MVENWNRKFAFYAVSLYRVGNYTDAALVGSIMFEKAVYYLLLNQEISKNDIKERARVQGKGSLEVAINLIKNNYGNTYNIDDLHKIRKLRNDITHELNINEIVRGSIRSMILFIWKVLNKEKFELYNGEFNSIDFTIADYAIVNIREIFNENLQDILAIGYNFSSFKKEDFQELNILREKMLSLGSKLKRDFLKIKYKDDLYIDIISKIDTTSAYVWLSMNLRNEKRERINSASASILVTPLDLRIYFDIGGGGYDVRKDYYQFLKSEYFQNFRANVNVKDIEIFDNDWYCFIIKRSKLSNLSYENFIARVEEAEAKLKETNENIPITWNRMLFGYIIERGNISYAEIEKKLDLIIRLYYCFELFRAKYLKREEIKFHYNIGNLCNKHIKQKIFLAKNILNTTNNKKVRR